MKWNKDSIILSTCIGKKICSQAIICSTVSYNTPSIDHKHPCLKMQSTHLQWRTSTQPPRCQVCKAICLECQHLCWSKCGFVSVSQKTLKAPSCCICCYQIYSKFKQNWESCAAFINAPSLKYITSKQQHVRNIQINNT